MATLTPITILPDDRRLVGESVPRFECVMSVSSNNDVSTTNKNNPPKH